MPKKLKKGLKKRIKETSKLKSKRVSKKAKKSTTEKIKKIIKKSVPNELEGMTLIGEITHYFPHVKAGVIILKEGTLSKGDMIFIKGHTTKFKQRITSLQINRVDVNGIHKGDEAGVLVKSRVRIGDSVYKI